MEGIYSYVGTVASLALRLADERSGAAYLLTEATHDLGKLIHEFGPTQEEWNLLDLAHGDR